MNTNAAHSLGKAPHNSCSIVSTLSTIQSILVSYVTLGLIFDDNENYLFNEALVESRLLFIYDTFKYYFLVASVQSRI